MFQIVASSILTFITAIVQISNTWDYNCWCSSGLCSIKTTVTCRTRSSNWRSVEKAGFHRWKCLLKETRLENSRGEPTCEWIITLRRIWTSFLFPRKNSPRITILNLLVAFIYRSSYSRLTHSLNLVRGTLMAYWMGTNFWHPKCAVAAKDCTFGACLAAARLPGVPLASHCHATVLPTPQPPKTTHWC